LEVQVLHPILMVVLPSPLPIPQVLNGYLTQTSWLSLTTQELTLVMSGSTMT
jgi:hypothetical protein